MVPTPSFWAIRYLAGTLSLTGILDREKLLRFCRLRTTPGPFLCSQGFWGLFQQLLRKTLQNLKRSPQQAPTLQSHQALSKAGDQARRVLQRFSSFYRVNPLHRPGQIR